MIKKFRRRTEHGQTMAEFTLVLPVLAILLFGVIQFGIVFNNYLAVTDAVRAGARQAAVARYLPPGQRESKVKAKVYASASGLDTSKLKVTVAASDSWNPGSDVTVTASYPYSINLLGRVVKSGALTSSTTERVE
ncbi:MAG TPA: TadE/TadG family type IV pilus assembly protein [Gaiellaceae bacterium]|nr:TadE/TadG family type IV pilus assembly protein [Gaiellaceae bacterium]